MEQSSQNENKINNEHGCEIMDDAMEERTRELFERPFENHESLQIELRKNEIMKDNFKKIMYKEINGKIIIEMQYVRHFTI